MTPEEADEIATMMAAAFPVPARPALTIALFAEDIQDLPFEPAMAAARTWRRAKREHPAASDIRDMCAQHMAMAEMIPGELDPDEAWGFVVRCVSTIGRYRTFPRTHARVADTVERMGWEEICTSDNSEATRAHFLQLYRTAAARQRQARLDAPALALPSDAAQLAIGRGEPSEIAAPAKQLPAPASRTAGASAIRDVISSLGVAPPPVPVVEAGAMVEQPRKPAEAELAAAESRRDQLRSQLRLVDGGKAA